MSLNDRLIEVGATDWWIQEIKRNLKKSVKAKLIKYNTKANKK